MENHSIANLLNENTYPGRGILIGKSPDGKKFIVAYFIMGRSENSRNRVFVKTDDGIKTEAFDPSKLSDPSLIIYHPVRLFNDELIVTNGDQTDTIRDFLAKDSTFIKALRTREFEPDSPNFTPRISGILSTDGSYKMSILKSEDEKGSSCSRFTYEFFGIDGFAHFIHTYKCDGTPIPSFKGTPKRIYTFDDIDEFTNILWENLNEENKVSLYVRYIDVATQEIDERIVNKNK